MGTRRLRVASPALTKGARHGGSGAEDGELWRERVRKGAANHGKVEETKAAPIAIGAARCVARL
jgi:hypothetical protein